MFVVERKDVYTVKEMCRALRLSESGYYRWLRNRGKHSSRQLLAVKIKKIRITATTAWSASVSRLCRTVSTLAGERRIAS